MSVLDLSLCACFPTSDGLFCWCQYFPIQVACYWLHSPIDLALQAGRGKHNMDLGGGMYPVWFFQLLNAMVNWSQQVALPLQEALREYRSVCSPYMSLEQSVMRVTALLKMFAMEREGGFSHPDFVGNQMTSKERTPYHHFIPQAW
ncbi:hypothetical protein I79_013951 [Cricetulus griseus]|uniref:Uncharacterized protein n=1 Tax=Cricetulus griseus TaxID=10029 RepID=G3HSV3_CRIGR|nr:hypothetical protein I79_013951 [Cricetulus griseus]